MSKKNLSLLMDGFMGEANSSDSVQEQPKEQAVELAEAQAEQPDRSQRRNHRPFRNAWQD